MSFTIHLLREADIDATDEVIVAAYNLSSGRKDTLRQYLTLQPDGAFIVKDDTTIVGFGAALDYGPFAYIGMMTVQPTLQKRGIGRLLMDYILAWLEERGCQTVLLDANNAGEPLYVQYGFVEDDRTLDILQTERLALVNNYSEHISTLRDEDFVALATFDATHFGASREALLAIYCADNPHRVFVAHNTYGEITGYVIAQTNVIGPWVARTIEDAEQLLRQALALSYAAQPRVFVSAQNENALQLLKRYGFSQTRSLSHMRKGLFIERSRPTTLYGQVSLGLG